MKYTILDKMLIFWIKFYRGPITNNARAMEYSPILIWPIKTMGRTKKFNLAYWLSVVYKIPYRRAPRLACRLPLGRLPLGRVRRASKGILHTRLSGDN